MKRLSFIILAVLLACTAYATKENPLVFDSIVCDFGTVKEADGTLFHTFHFINAASATTVISKVTASCSCVTVSYPQARMKGGEAGEISVALNPLGLLGDIVREVFVCVEGYDPVMLELKADIVPSKLEINDIYRVSLPSGLRMTTATANFGYIALGHSEKKRIDIVNTSSAPLRIGLEVLSAASFLNAACPELLAPGEAGSIILNYSLPDSDRAYGRHTDEIRIYINDNPVTRTVSTSSIGVGAFPAAGKPKPAFQTYPSKPQPKKSLFGGWTASFTVKNAGKGDLVIYKVQSDDFTECSIEDGEVIPAGKEKKVTLRSGNAAMNAGLVTNDPSRPFKEIHTTNNQ